MKYINDENGPVTKYDLSEREKEKLLSELWELLKIQADKYNGIDSTSMPIEKAQDILQSLLYTIGVAVDNGISEDEVLNGDLSHLIDRGQNILKEKKKTVKVELKLMCRELPEINNVYYLSTLKNIGVFFKNYNIYYEAHNIPCSIDYWPLCPISEKVKGISYIEEFIARIQIENDFLNCFEQSKLISLYRRFMPGYSGALFNLCEPVLSNAIGLGMLEQDIHNLNVSAARRNDIFHLLFGKSQDEIQTIIEQAVLFVCEKLGMTERREQNYLVNAASGMSARVSEALEQQDLSNIFISF